MTKGRDNQAARLSDILEIIKVRRQNGLLSVERFEDGRFDEGDIYLEQGQPVDARAGNLVGEDAFVWLANWRQVYFAFTKDAPRPDWGNPSPPASSSARQKVLREGDLGYGQVVPSPGLLLSGMQGLVPQKVAVDQSVLSLPLTRPQRSIYLLVDGCRTISDLARCTRKNVQEVQRLLRELQDHGLVSLEPRPRSGC